MYIFFFLGHYFQVTLEDCPDDSFTSVSAESCWKMVIERLNQEIKRLSSLGKQGLPYLQPLKSIDGLEMFGLLSQPVIQVNHYLFISFVLFCLIFTLFYG